MEARPIEELLTTMLDIPSPLQGKNRCVLMAIASSLHGIFAFFDPLTICV
jgi:hypothetical protein